MENLYTIDFHSHILPAVDDGSQSLEMTREMLLQSGEAGVDLMVATPHFYGYRDTLEAFLERRHQARQAIGEILTPEMPGVRLGAEVAFYSGLEDLDGLEQLCIQGTNVLLLEMPFAAWTEYEWNVLMSLMLDRDLQIILAHFERYYEFQSDPNLTQRMKDLSLYLQINAGTLIQWKKRGRWLNWLARGDAHVLGSDTHNLTSRAPNLGQAREVVRKKLGAEVLECIDRTGNQLLAL